MKNRLKQLIVLFLFINFLSAKASYLPNFTSFFGRFLPSATSLYNNVPSFAEHKALYIGLGVATAGALAFDKYICKIK